MFNDSNVLFNALYMYADDTCIYNIYISGSDINALFDVLNIELAALLEWLIPSSSLLMLAKYFPSYFVKEVSKLVI